MTMVEIMKKRQAYCSCHLDMPGGIAAKGKKALLAV